MPDLDRVADPRGTRPRIIDTELVEAFVTASRALVGVAVRSLAASPVTLTVAQHRALVLIASGRATTVAALREHLGVNQSNASRLVERLERLGVVARERSASDARTFHITPTALGRSSLEAVTRHRRAQIASVLERMPEPDRAGALRAMLAFDGAARETAVDAWPVEA